MSRGGDKVGALHPQEVNGKLVFHSIQKYDYLELVRWLGG